MTQGSIESTYKRKPNYRVLTIILAVICGGLLMYVSSDFLEKNTTSQRQNSTEYKDLTNVLIEIHGGLTAGINKDDWNTKMRELTIAASKYKIHMRPTDKESAALDNVINTMRKAQDYWKIDIPYNCMNKKPSDVCIQNYALELYRILPAPIYTADEFTKNLTKYVREQDTSLSDNNDGLISFSLSETSNAITDFFKLHGITL